MSLKKLDLVNIWVIKVFYLLLIQVKTPFGWNVMIYLGCNALSFRDASQLILQMVTLATTGDGINAASSAPKRYSLTTEWAPSAPIRRFPVALVPSVKVMVTNSSPRSIDSSFFPNYRF